MESSKDIDHQESESSSHSDDAISIESESEMNSEQQTKHSSVDSYTQYVFIMNEVCKYTTCIYMNTILILQ